VALILYGYGVAKGSGERECHDRACIDDADKVRGDDAAPRRYVSIT
jgi:hypothetical protein